jgi:hypothetical protein
MIATKAFHFYPAHLSDGHSRQPFCSKAFTNLLSIADVQYEIIAFVIRGMQQANRRERPAYAAQALALGHLIVTDNEREFATSAVSASRTGDAKSRASYA